MDRKYAAVCSKRFKVWGKSGGQFIFTLATHTRACAHPRRHPLAPLHFEEHRQRGRSQLQKPCRNEKVLRKGGTTSLLFYRCGNRLRRKRCSRLSGPVMKFYTTSLLVTDWVLSGLSALTKPFSRYYVVVEVGALTGADAVGSWSGIDQAQAGKSPTAGLRGQASISGSR